MVLRLPRVAQDGAETSDFGNDGCGRTLNARWIIPAHAGTSLLQLRRTGAGCSARTSCSFECFTAQAGYSCRSAGGLPTRYQMTLAVADQIGAAHALQCFAKHRPVLRVVIAHEDLVQPALAAKLGVFCAAFMKLLPSLLPLPEGHYPFFFHRAAAGPRPWHSMTFALCCSLSTRQASCARPP